MKKIGKEVEEYLDLFCNISGGGIFAIKMDDEYTLEYGSIKYFDILEYNPTELEERLQNKCVRYIYGPDVESANYYCQKSVNHMNQNFEWDMRIVTGKGNIKWVRVQATTTDKLYNAPTMYGYLTDITDSKRKSFLEKTADYVKEKQDQLNLYRTINNGGVFVLSALGELELLYANDKYYEFHGYTPESMKRLHGNKFKNYICAADVDRVMLEIEQCLNNNEKRFDSSMHVICGNGEQKYVMMRSEVLSLDGKPVISGIVIDITEQRHAEERAIINNKMMHIAAEQSGMAFWTIDIKTHTITQEPYVQKIFGYDMIVENVPECLFGTGLIHPDDEPTVRELYNDVFLGKNASIIVRTKHMTTGEYWWCKMVYTPIFDENNNYINAIGSARDVSDQIMLEKEFDKQLSYLNIMEQNVLGSFRFNLTKNLCKDGRSAFEYILEFEKDGTVDGFFSRVYREIPSGKDLEEYIEIFNRENLIVAFEQGKSNIAHEHKLRVEGNKYEWVVTHIDMVKNPLNGNIEALIYAFNINAQRILKDLFASVITVDYDYIIELNIKCNSYIMYFYEQISSPIPSRYGSNYEEAFSSYCNLYIHPDDRERTMQNTRLNKIVDELEKNNKFGFVTKIMEGDGSVTVKKLQYSYIDRSSGLVLLTRIDMTKEFEKEQQKNYVLETALVAAEQANAAKTDFLSRMSHEIRTPMNAIIGMCAIAMQSIDTDRVRDCLSKIDTSSKFLLALINDILDMSRIESGKVLLSCDKIVFQDLINNINSICYAQAKVKDVRYESIISSSVADFYEGDAMKLQQIIINILSNAVKFTPKGGSVYMSVSEVAASGQEATLRLAIKDTGCGISKEFLPYLFDAFTQEHTGNTAMYGGTGLGLAICKNLVSMMDGKIEVNSSVNAGTEFVVEVKLGRSTKNLAVCDDGMLNDIKSLRVLIIDDDDVICRNSVIMLDELGLSPVCSTSGEAALDMVRGGSRYDVIFIDWKMPNMDGIETTRRLRELVGSDVAIVMMTAYDWAAIERSAKAAGANLVISKPLFKSSFISTLAHLLRDKQEEEGSSESASEYNFNGKRILIAEDQPLNVEVAKMILSSRGIEVDHAENGEEAVAKFKNAASYYYDAILMDIRMPIMDGLQATIEIRQLPRADAAIVPIIAMTANAFNEDINKSKEAGMNAHLAKPIDPKKLFTTLYEKLLKKQ